MNPRFDPDVSESGTKFLLETTSELEPDQVPDQGQESDSVHMGFEKISKNFRE